MKIPWSKLYLDEKELNGVINVVKSGWLSMGPKVQEFEGRMANYVGVKHAIAVSSGTAALDIALKLLGINDDDEVIVPAMAYIATANSVLYQHAVPVFADIDSRTFNIDPDDVKKKITEKTKCIIPIDYGGQSADYEKLKKIAYENNIYIVEDGAPGLGGEYKGKKLCSFGDISTTSFHVAKNFTTIEGGMIFTNNDEYDKKARIILSQGEDPGRKYHHIFLGHNYRMTDINASIGIAQTSRIEKVLDSKREAAKYYISKLCNHNSIVIPHVKDDCVHAWFLFPILISNRDKVKDYLAEKGIGTNVSWPIPIYDQEIFKPFKKEKCLVAEEITKKILCLPIFYKISKEEQDYVVEHLINAVERFT